MRHLTRSARGALALAGVALVALGGCTARTEVALTVRAADAADVVISASFTGEAAQVMHSQPEILEELVATFEDRTGATPAVSSDSELVHVEAKVDYAHLTQSGSITGVGEVRLASSGQDVQASVELRDAPDLATAIQSATASQPDAGAVYATMAQGTQLAVSVTFPGGITGQPQLIGVSASALEVTGTTATVVRSLDDAASGAVVVVGDPNAPLPWLWIGAGGVLIVVGTAAAIAYRKDQSDPLRPQRQ